MIILFHKKNEVIEIYDFEKNLAINANAKSIQETVIFVANENKERFIGWCHVDLKDDLNLEAGKLF